MQTLRLFVDVARCHSFSKAAVAHGITQSAASQRISQLEKNLGATLLDRSVRPLELTRAGQVFLDGVTDLLTGYDRLKDQVALLSADADSEAAARAEADIAGHVRVAAIYSSGIELLNRIRERFVAEHPRIEVEIRYNQPDQVYDAVRAFECDLGILSYPQRWRQVGVIPLRDEVMAVVCPPGHPLAERERIEAAELSGYEMVGFDRELPAGRRIRQYLRDNAAQPTVVNSFDNIDTIKGVLTVTQRFSILPKRTVAREVAAGQLCMVELKPALVRPIGMIYRRRHKHGEVFSPASQTFVDYLLKHAGPSVDLTGPAMATRDSRADRSELVGERA
ncbi:LysR family transcriptional regulator [Phycisphaerales bacterium AB-hyl4]|uniref:LysR family transcriptional regulator n=1 Tax=Natronomicrosphaera hydrolytica TaxID=3242702 RepID=A0ABV4UAX5_9BACT